MQKNTNNRVYAHRKIHDFLLQNKQKAEFIMKKLICGQLAMSFFIYLLGKSFLNKSNNFNSYYFIRLMTIIKKGKLN